jgi:hypothetical protein
MIYKIEKQILDFVKTDSRVKRAEMVHGSLFVVFDDERDTDAFHSSLRSFFTSIDIDGGVNMNGPIGDEYAFDFVPLDDEREPLYSQIDTALEIEADMTRGK